MADMPDLSHLTPEERAIIENVMLRQKQEEESEKELMKWVNWHDFASHHKKSSLVALEVFLPAHLHSTHTFRRTQSVSMQSSSQSDFS